MPRLIDLGVGLLLLAVFSPLLLVVGLANRVATGGVFFRQTRVGRGLAPFVIFKFQTMSSPPPGATTIAGADRSRLRPFGRLLRSLKVDELPQLINVVRGEMSLVGPRALTPNEIARVPREVAAAVYKLRPGMTGLSSLVFADEERLVGKAANPEEYYFASILPRKMALEAAYARRRTLSLDLVMLGLTPLAMVSPRAARVLALRVAGPVPAPGTLRPPVPSGEITDA